MPIRPNSPARLLRRRAPLALTIVVSALSALAAQAAPVPSSFGSPDQLLREKGTFEIVGIKLGMPIDAALDALKAYDPKLKIAPKSGAFQLMPQLKFTPAYAANEVLAPDGSLDTHRGPESFLILATTPPGPSHVWGISRTIVFPDAAKRPLLTAFVQSLRDKYGTPTVDQTTAETAHMEWVVDKDGKLWPAHQKGYFCMSQFHLLVERVEPHAFNDFARFISMGRGASLTPGNPRTLAAADATAGCHTTAVLEINAGTDGHGRLDSVNMVAQNYRLGWASLDATRQLLLEAQEAQAEKEKAKAGSQSGPKL